MGLFTLQQYDMRYRALRPFKVIQGHRHWYQLTARVQFSIGT